MLRLGQLYRRKEYLDENGIGSVFFARGIEPNAVEFAVKANIDIITV